eukprot:maker-scaffold776_size99073-snap-gene-0.17 protein:Tk00560 transcript:maker-scaffold776_size99073-snap-gene-0.17-mRNA-1 annotation:"hypothetical protein DAPPUDRAFT_312923"
MKTRPLLLLLGIASQLLGVCRAQGFIFPDDDEAKTSADFTEEAQPNTNSGACLTVEGPAKGLPCVFPFKFQNFTFDGCTTITDSEKRPWCSTKVNANGVHIGAEGHWGHCDVVGCPMTSEDTIDEYTSLEEDYLDRPIEDYQVDEFDPANPRTSLQEFKACTTSKATDGICEPAILCAGVTEEDIAANPCELEEGNPDDLGVCCESRLTNEIQITFTEPTEKEIEVENVSVNEINEFVAMRFLDTPETVAQAAPAPDDGVVGEEPLGDDIGEDDDPAEKNLSPEEAGFGLRMFDTDSSSAIDDICPWTPAPECDQNMKYRSFDGTCNNLKEPNYGRAVTPFQRILLPVYSGSLHLPRISVVNGLELPSARRVSLATTETNTAVDNEHTVLVMQMGQFIDHDLTHTPNHGQNCCGRDGSFPASFDAEKCFPIRMDQNDPFWKGRKTCMSLARSLASPGLKCSLEFRQQMNQITHWLDGSNIYGSSEGASSQLRQRFGGRLQITRQTGTRAGILPSCASNSNVGMCRGCSSCFFTGDARANEQLNLLVMHTIFMREHNRVAQSLQKLNPFWDDEKLYQEARKITVAEYQHVIYKEWLPIIIGGDFMDQFGLWPLSKGFSTTYMDSFDPRITNEFATAAFRFGHSIIPSVFKRIQNTRSNRGFTTTMNMREMFFKPNDMKQSAGMVDDLIRGLTTQEGELWDNSFSPDIQDHLFESGKNVGGLDLVSLNIQRGRDHGLPGYNAYRKICDVGAGQAKSFEDFEDVIDPRHVRKLKELYAHVDDVDLFVAGYLEIRDKDAILGPTFKCIIGDQFARLKLGDRFFYDLNHSSNVGFTEDQLQEIRKTSMARLVCDNADSIRSIQPQVMKVPGSSASNQIVSCQSIQIPSMNMGVFRGERTGKR